MSGLNIQEAFHEAEKMIKFFKAFEKLEEVLEVLNLSEQLIKERSDQAEALKKEIQNFSDQKALLVKGYDDEVYTARINSENAIEIYRKAQGVAEKKLIELQDHVLAEETEMIALHNSAIESRQTELNNLLLEIEKNSKLLTSAEKALDILRAKLG